MEAIKKKMQMLKVDKENALDAAEEAAQCAEEAQHGIVCVWWWGALLFTGSARSFEKISFVSMILRLLYEFYESPKTLQNCVQTLFKLWSQTLFYLRIAALPLLEIYIATRLRP